MTSSTTADRSSTLAAPGAPRAGCFTYLGFIIASGWLVLVSFGVQGAAWFADQIAQIQNTPPPFFAWPLIALGHALALLLPVALIAALTRAPNFRNVYRAWLSACAMLIVLGLARAFPYTWMQPTAAMQIVLTLSAALLLRSRRPVRGATESGRGSAILFALALAPLASVPWFWLGALGSPIDTLLMALEGLSFGLLAGTLLHDYLLVPLARGGLSGARLVLFGGFAALITLVVLAGGFGFTGSQLLLLIALPPLGFAAAALSRMNRGWLPLVALLGVSSAAPLMFFDPDELSLILGDNEILSWAFRAAGTSLVLAWALGFLLALLSGRLRTPRFGVSLALFAVLWASALALYALAGRPGFYGEQLFVILRSQADLRAASSIPNRDERTRFVYDTLTTHANRTQADLRATLNAARIEYQPYYLVNGLEVNGGPLVRAYLLTRPEVERVLDSPHLRPLPEPIPISRGSASAPTEPQWNITMLGAERVWREFNVTGKGIVIGQSDSGVQGDHPALRDRYRGRGGQHDYNWLDPWNHTRVPTDIGGHGTHTLGSLLGAPYIGVAPEAEWFACVNLARNQANPALYLTCMQFMLAPWPLDGDPLRDGDPRRAAHVLNNSWGCPPQEGCDAASLAPAVSALRAAGIFVVVSAGNEGPRCGSIDSPLAIYAQVFSVGALDRNGNIADFSSRGPVDTDGSQRLKPDIAAPGVDVLSAFPQDSYAELSGTSMAGPHVAGVVALLWSAQPKLIGDIERTEEILRQTARAYAGSRSGCFAGDRPNSAVGYGVVDAYAAVQAALGMR